MCGGSSCRSGTKGLPLSRGVPVLASVAALVRCAGLSRDVASFAARSGPRDSVGWQEPGPASSLVVAVSPAADGGGWGRKMLS
eukprot:CAMPEP_0114289890 /NCGR_PEP_ID=MMETSP0059-20121206/7623_1 /TAXON_ID=36894 /ORGANISM="Pyramimonas parkeae, Strain CCMP726" /LENGTH=82 /DNA_ID=CAMNT_0001411209 /DNA_START=1157 /DNA_END=1405 /DNA_ORIENTATION=+